MTSLYFCSTLLSPSPYVRPSHFNASLASAMPPISPVLSVTVAAVTAVAAFPDFAFTRLGQPQGGGKWRRGQKGKRRAGLAFPFWRRRVGRREEKEVILSQKRSFLTLLISRIQWGSIFCNTSMAAYYNAPTRYNRQSEDLNQSWQIFCQSHPS